MALTFYYLSGSPYAWRVWLALEHKRIPYELKAMSFDAGDLAKPEFLALNPRHKVPVIVDDGFVLYESASIVEYLDDKYPNEPHLFSTNLRDRAVQRRLVREADEYLAVAVKHLVESVLLTPQERWSEDRIAAASLDIEKEFAMWEATISGDFLAGALSAVDLTVFPQVASAQRIGRRKSDLLATYKIGPRISEWVHRMEALPLTQNTWPPHWK
jgi:glutathione S-transferase